MVIKCYGENQGREERENVEKALEIYTAVHRETLIIQRMIFEAICGVSGRNKHVWKSYREKERLCCKAKTDLPIQEIPLWTVRCGLTGGGQWWDTVGGKEGGIM